MRVTWLSLLDFRSYSALDWKPEPGVNLLLGPNGAGKTNLLEGVAYLATLGSFRSMPDAALIRDGADAAVIRAGISSRERERTIEIELPRTGPRRTQVDKSRLGRAADMLGVVRTVAFLPEDLDLVKRGPAYRRRLLDEVAVQLWPGAHLDQGEFERALRQRNAFLRSGETDPVTLDVWDTRLAQSGGRVMARRARVIESLAPDLAQIYSRIAGAAQSVSIHYRFSWSGRARLECSAGEFSDLLLQALQEARRLDYERRQTTVGPHRDDPVFLLDEVEARTHASQGEQRTMALAVKLAAHRAVAGVVGDDPVLVLDDVFSELDPERSKALAGALPLEAQTLISSARPEDVPLEGAVWRVGDGVRR